MKQKSGFLDLLLLLPFYPGKPRGTVLSFTRATIFMSHHSVTFLLFRLHIPMSFRPVLHAVIRLTETCGQKLGRTHPQWQCCKCHCSFTLSQSGASTFQFNLWEN